MYSYIDKIIDLALQEDIGRGDVTTDNVIDKNYYGSGVVVCNEDLIIAGLNIFRKVFKNLDPNVNFYSKFVDGNFVKKNDVIIEIEGSITSLLIGERTALNFMQHLSGIATKTRNYVEKIKNTDIKIIDTRKTLPCLRYLEKYAIRMGGGYNHRFGLFDGVLIKDNHIKVCGGILKTVKKIRKNISHLTKIEVEVSSVNEVKEALLSGVDIIMLDNMTMSDIKKSVDIINKKALIEVSGNITFDRLEDLSKTGIDLISIGALTHSAPSVDLSMNLNIISD